MDIFPTRQSFADAVVDAFNTTKGKSNILQYALCKEPHSDRGEHYHMCVKLLVVFGLVVCNLQF